MTQLQELAAKFTAAAFNGPAYTEEEIDAYNIGFQMGGYHMGSLAKFIEPANIREAYTDGYADGASAVGP